MRGRRDLAAIVCESSFRKTTAMRISGLLDTNSPREDAASGGAFAEGGSGQKGNWLAGNAGAAANDDPYNLARRAA